MNAMGPIRERTKAHLPTVLLTLLSIIQALSLEFLWTHVKASDYLFTGGWPTLLYWAQILATFLGIVLIWIVYSMNALRFRWVPRTADSVLPFVVGLFEFALIELLGPGKMGWWFICFASIYALMTWVDHSIMRHARQDCENEVFFSRFKPATLKDFYPSIAIVVLLIGVGAMLVIGNERGVFATTSLVAVNIMCVWLIGQTSMYWNRSVSGEIADQLADDG